TRQGLFEDYNMDIHEDSKGNFWLSGQKGVSRVSKKQLEDVADGKIAVVTATGYGRADGVRSGVASGNTPNVCRTSDGRLWLPTYDGNVVIYTGPSRPTDVMPPVIIEQVMIDRKQVEMGRALIQSAHKGELEFHYTAPSFTMP